jgi:signal transduction histidine kinase
VPGPQASKRRAHPVAVDAAVAVVLAGLLLACAASNEDEGAYVNAAAAGLALLACAPIVLRRERPMLSLVLTVAGGFLALATFKPQAMVIAPIALVLYSVAVTGTPRRTLVVGAVSVALTVGAMWIFAESKVLHLEMLEKLGLVLLPLIAGEAIREKRAYLCERAERERRAERARAEEAERRIEHERLRIAREVHDVVAHSMVAINVQAGVAAHLADRRPEAAKEALRDIKRASGDALRDLRATLGVLRDGAEAVPTAPAPDLEAVRELAEPLRAAGIDVTIDLDVAGCRGVPPPLGRAGYRIVQEALTNVLRHSGTSAVRVDVAVRGGGVDIEVLDDGPAGGAAAAAATGAGSGNGLRGMRERAAAVGGSVEAGPRDEGGWRVRAQLPVQVATA